jgi:predicted TIM-barrel fold metal-dependent hydrolase
MSAFNESNEPNAPSVPDTHNTPSTPNVLNAPNLPAAPVIDFHLHAIAYQVQNESYLNWVIEMHGREKWDYAYKRYQDPGLFCEYMRQSGIDYGVLMAELTPITTGICTNEYILDFCRDRPSLIPFASINPFMTTNISDELTRLVALGFRGLKMYPTYQHFYPNDNKLYPLYATAEKLQIPIMFHTGSSVFTGSRIKYGDPVYYDDVAVDFPGLNILLVHGGRGFWYDSAFFLARLHENVYLEVAGLPPQKLLQYFPELDRIPDKVIYGSDWPGGFELSAGPAAVRALPIADETKRKILGGNAARILNLKY